jgi:probable HAF family extracellular repeat protein
MKLMMTFVCLSGISAMATAADYQYATVDFPGSANTAVYAVNDLGQFVGAEKDTSGAHHAIFDNGSQLLLLDPSGTVGTAQQSWALSINRHGDIAGAYLDATGESHGYLYHGADGTVTTIDYPGGNNTQAYGVNDKGHLIGVYNDADGNPHTFLLKDGSFSSLDIDGGLQTVPLSINDRDEIVGEYVTTANTNGYGYIQYPSGKVRLVTAPGSQPEGTYFISINNRNQVLGQYLDADGNSVNFIRSGKHYANFDLPASFGATYVSAQTLNDHDEIVGYYVDSGNVAHGFTATKP